MKTKIEWTDLTDNIVTVEGGGYFCTKISAACKNCYAEKLNLNKFFGGNGRPYTGEAPKMRLRRDILARWPRQRVPKKHFVASMTDVFGEWLPGSWMFEFLDAMAAAPNQTFQILTKRNIIAARVLCQWLDLHELKRLPANIWIGFTAENQQCFDERWDSFRHIKERLGVIFISCEPLLGRIELPPDFLALGKRGWVIAGGESGPHARPMDPWWPVSLREQCLTHHVPFFFKQWGEWAPGFYHESIDSRQIPVATYTFSTAAARVYRVSKKRAGRLLYGQEWNQFPEAA